MTTQEFSNTFDALLNSFGSKAVFGDQASQHEIVLDEYEKSVFLTEAQEELITSYYNGRNSNLLSFEKTEEVRRYLSSLIRTAELTPTSGTGIKKLDSNSQIFTLPDEVWFITYEAGTLGSNSDSCISGKSVEVVPVTQDYFHRVRKNPFRGPSKKRALRLDLEDKKVEIVSKYTLSKYIVRYIVKPAPIVLSSLDGLSINGVSTEQTCELDESLHRPILELAVRLALQSKGINIKDNN